MIGTGRVDGESESSRELSFRRSPRRNKGGSGDAERQEGCSDAERRNTAALVNRRQILVLMLCVGTVVFHALRVSRSYGRLASSSSFRRSASKRTSSTLCVPANSGRYIQSTITGTSAGSFA